jgi:hypothetical protein
MEEVFGDDNFIAKLIVQKTTSSTNVTIPQICDFILWFAKKKEAVKYRAFIGQRATRKVGHCTTLKLGRRMVLCVPHRMANARAGSLWGQEKISSRSAIFNRQAWEETRARERLRGFQ